jgi:hypothetical protein
MFVKAFYEWRVGECGDLSTAVHGEGVNGFGRDDVVLVGGGGTGKGNGKDRSRFLRCAAE